MAELVYDKDGRLLFTKEMKEEYTILFPTMLPVHFGLIAKVFAAEGYNVEMLTTSHRGIVDEGLKYVHNDTCYPALLVIGQLPDRRRLPRVQLHPPAPQSVGEGRTGLHPRRFSQPVRSGKEPRL